MSFNRVHTAETTIDGQTLWLGVYADESANLIINGTSYITLDKYEGRNDVLLTGNASDETIGQILEWLDEQLAKGRAE